MMFNSFVRTIAWLALLMFFSALLIGKIAYRVNEFIYRICKKNANCSKKRPQNVVQAIIFVF